MEIENKSMEIIKGELDEMGIKLQPEEESLVLRAIHASADMDYARNLIFINEPVKAGVEAILAGRAIITDTNMALSGIHKKSLEGTANPLVCYMADEEVAIKAREKGTTRAEVSMERASAEYPGGIYAIGNAPTALLKLCELIEEEGFRPSLIIGIPVGFVNVVESKERLKKVCEIHGLPCIIGMGRKGGSTIAAALINALIYKIGR
ncbi:precorrin-8X methylmutase [Butyrivibrio sp. MC2013]|uniref:precorrin-8X methylmutase n=1 Tax=Butyrivibrio sp. MC2013 TaxID=1280686 RepID=UPI00056C56B5|nr:precorrin-8X methylmutase [Butyrivibrio sp. MC2013]